MITRRLIYFLFCTLFCIGVCRSATAETKVDGDGRHMVFLGGGAGFAFMYPKAVNRYLEDWIDRQNAVSSSGTVRPMVLSMVPRISAAYAPISQLQFELFSEFGWAPKVIIVSGGDTGFFNFIRFSNGMHILASIPIHSPRHAVYFGGGPSVEVMKLDNYTAVTMGGRGVVGLRFNQRALCWDYFLSFLYTRANSDTYRDTRLELAYTSVMMGINLYFSIDN